MSKIILLQHSLALPLDWVARLALANISAGPAHDNEAAPGTRVIWFHDNGAPTVQQIERVLGLLGAPLGAEVAWSDPLDAALFHVTVEGAQA